MLEVKVERCAGIDVGKKFLDVCVLVGPVDRKPAEEIRRFGTALFLPETFANCAI
jgi:transposase